jgi:uncharacterized membrane protein YeaQ/YmgE (transglycosylase-associated protein family)
MSGQTLLVIGLIAGWLAGHVRGTAYGLIADIALGIVGAIIGVGCFRNFTSTLGQRLSPPLSERPSVRFWFWSFCGLFIEQDEVLADQDM